MDAATWQQSYNNVLLRLGRTGAGSGRGGGLDIQFDSTATISRTDFNHNLAEGGGGSSGGAGQGGALANIDSATVVTNSSFCHDVSQGTGDGEGEGGGIYSAVGPAFNDVGTSVTVMNSNLIQ
jgi:hypothetical protein